MVVIGSGNSTTLRIIGSQVTGGNWRSKRTLRKTGNSTSPGSNRRFLGQRIFCQRKGFDERRDRISNPEKPYPPGFDQPHFWGSFFRETFAQTQWCDIVRSGGYSANCLAALAQICMNAFSIIHVGCVMRGIRHHPRNLT